jgi:glycerophosphoryl diester phosphodiesterase
VQRLMPHVATVALTEEQNGGDTVRIGASSPSPWLGGLDPAHFGNSVVRLVKATGAGTWGPDYQDLNAQRIAEAHALGLRVVPWTVNAPVDMERLLAFGIDGMTTDRPDVLRKLLESKGLPVPQPLPEDV